MDKKDYLIECMKSIKDTLEDIYTADSAETVGERLGTVVAQISLFAFYRISDIRKTEAEKKELCEEVFDNISSDDSGINKEDYEKDLFSIVKETKEKYTDGKNL